MLALALSLCLTPSVRACPLCSEDTEKKQEETGVNVAMGYTVSVLFMILMPLTMAGGFGYFLYRTSKSETNYLKGVGSSDKPVDPLTGKHAR